MLCDGCNKAIDLVCELEDLLGRVTGNKAIFDATYRLKKFINKQHYCHYDKHCDELLRRHNA